MNAALNDKFAIIGGGSWATALAKILTDHHVPIHWWVRNQQIIDHMMRYHHNPHYLRSASFNTALLTMHTDIAEVIRRAEFLIMAVPSAYITNALQHLPKDIFKGKKIISAIKGILPEHNLLLNDYLHQHFDVDIQHYYTVMGPCHAEEVASEKLSYLTFSGLHEETTQWIADQFRTHYMNTVVNDDVVGVQYAAVLKNIYALGAGIAHGLEYGDNFLSVFIANAADEMACFLRKAGIRNIEVGVHKEPIPGVQLVKNPLRKSANYAASVYLGDLLVTCYSLFSRNRTFGNMIGKGFSVKTAQLEMDMVAEGHNATRCMYITNQTVQADMPIAETLYRILWENLSPAEGFRYIEEAMI